MILYGVLLWLESESKASLGRCLWPPQVMKHLPAARVAGAHRRPGRLRGRQQSSAQ